MQGYKLLTGCVDFEFVTVVEVSRLRTMASVAMRLRWCAVCALTSLVRGPLSVVNSVQSPSMTSCRS